MKKNLIIPLLLICMQSIAQDSLLKVRYQTETVTFYKHPDPDLSGYDLIKYRPKRERQQVEKVFYSNGEVETQINYIEQENNSWYDNPNSISLNHDSIKVQTAKEQISISTFEEEGNIEDDASFITHYLGTNPWQLPISTEHASAIHANGFEIEINTANELRFRNETDRFTYNRMLKTEVWEKHIDKAYTETQTTGYTINDGQFWVYDFTLYQSYLPNDDPCIEQYIYTQYSNIDRIFYNPTYMPFGEEQTSNLPILTFSAKQLGTSSFIEIKFTEPLDEPVKVTFLDGHGNAVEEPYNVIDNTTILSIPHLRTGLYYVTLSLPSTPQKLFIKS